jgi:hypothetical protein
MREDQALRVKQRLPVAVRDRAEGVAFDLLAAMHRTCASKPDAHIDGLTLSP